MDESTESSYGMILGRDLLTSLEVDIDFCKNMAAIRKVTNEGFA